MLITRRYLIMLKKTFISSFVALAELWPIINKQLLYFFESALSPNVFWVDLKKINFKDGKTRRLDLGPDQSHIYAGNATSSFKIAKPFVFLSPTTR
ncbi:hypothetical protein D3C80_167050 [compost metagenome]